MDVQEKHQSVISCMPPTGDRPATQACDPTGNQISNLLVCETVPNPLSYTGQGHFFFLIFKNQKNNIL